MGHAGKLQTQNWHSQSNALSFWVVSFLPFSYHVWPSPCAFGTHSPRLPLSSPALCITRIPFPALPLAPFSLSLPDRYFLPLCEFFPRLEQKLDQFPAKTGTSFGSKNGTTFGPTALFNHVRMGPFLGPLLVPNLGPLLVQKLRRF